MILTNQIRLRYKGELRLATKNITVPDIGGASDVEVIEVLVKVGDRIQVGTPLITLESDKATMEVPSSDEGVVKEIQVKVGSKVSMGSTILILELGANQSADKMADSTKFSAGKTTDSSVEKTTDSSKSSEKTSSSTTEAGAKANLATKEPPNADASAQKEFSGKESAEKPNQKSSPGETSSENAKTTDQTFLPGNQAAIHAGPAVRKLAREFGIDLTAVKATGPKQRLLKEDIQLYVKNRLAQPPATSSMQGLPTVPTIDFAKFGPIETQALSRIKKISGKNLHRNWLLVPHVTQFGEADITEMENFRVARNAMLDKKGIKLTPLVFILKAIVSGLKQFPQFNASLDPNGEQLILKKYFHIGVAVDTSDGLVVPVIRDVDKKGVTDLAKELAEVSEKARNKQLTSNDMQGGTFSISSLGGIGGTAFTPIVNVPEVAILGVSKSSYKPIYQDGHFIPRLMLPLSVSYDHRVIDGADGARFMVHLTNTLADIRNLLL